jgi:CTP-dependent riboflavin kinase
LAVATLIENGLKDVTVVIGDVSVLPVEVDGISGAVTMPKA